MREPHRKVPLVRAIDRDGNTLGYLSLDDCDRFGLTVSRVETPARYLDDPYVIYHADMAYEQGLLTNGRDLNPIQAAMLLSVIVRRERRRRERDEAMILSNMALLRPDAYQRYIAQKDAERQAEEDEVDESSIEWKVPRSMDEFLEILKDIGGEDEQEPTSMRLRDELPDEVVAEIDDEEE